MTMEIILIRVDGPTYKRGKSFTCASFADANSQLLRWSWTAPEHGGYNEIDFTVIDTKADIHYTGRYDLKHWTVGCPSLPNHIIDFVQFMAGDDRPRH